MNDEEYCVLESRGRGCRLEKRLSIKYELIGNKSLIAIRPKSVWTKNPKSILKKDVLIANNLSDAPRVINQRFSYRLDYKSKTNYSTLGRKNRMAEQIETVALRHGHDLTAASRDGRFYDKYWWFQPDAGIAQPSLP